jgi:hypothetical protein
MEAAAGPTRAMLEALGRQKPPSPRAVGETLSPVAGGSFSVDPYFDGIIDDLRV